MQNRITKVNKIERWGFYSAVWLVLHITMVAINITSLNIKCSFVNIVHLYISYNLPKQHEAFLFIIEGHYVLCKV